MLASVSIDLDGLDLYHRIHGLAPPTQDDPIYRVALPRFLELFDEIGVHGIPSTLFVITRYMDADERTIAPLELARDGGHELASHTHDHPYDLSRMASGDVADQIDLASDALERHFGVTPVGFRTPGYNLSNTILECLEARGYAYDSSVFPCPPYYLAKGVIMAGMRLLGRKSGSSMTDWRGNLAPIVPYRPAIDAFQRRDRSGNTAIRELPMCVVPGVRFPIIGTSLTLIGDRGFRAAYPLLKRAHDHLNLEFHGVDLMDASDDGVTPELVAKQPDLRKPVSEKRRIFKAVFERALADYDFVTLADSVS